MKKDRTKKYTEYKNFTPMHCKCCNALIDEDIHDSLCLNCLSYAFPEDDEENEFEFESYQEDKEYRSIA